MSKKKITIFSDGASRGNPGMAGAGILIDGFLQSHSLSIYLGKKTNNEAEYLAVLAGLKQLVRLIDKESKNSELVRPEVLFNLDSKLVVEQMSGRWKIKEDRIQKLVDLCKTEILNTNCFVKFQHIPREQNAEADWLANLAIDLAEG